MYKLLLVFICLAPLDTIAQYSRGAYGVEVDRKGGIIVSGEGLHGAGFNADTLDGVGVLSGYFMAKFSSEGITQWIVGEGVETLGNAIAVYEGENIVQVPVDVDSQNHHSVSSLKKYNASGQVLWSQPLPDAPFSRADVDADENGFCVSAGRQHSNRAPEGFAVIRFDATGTPLWNDFHQMNYWQGAHPKTTVAAFEGGCIVSGVFVDTLTFESDTGPIRLVAPSAEIGDIGHYIARYDQDGNVLWTKKLEMKGYGVNEIVGTIDGSIYFGGSYGSEGAAFGEGTERIVLNSVSSPNAFLVKLDRMGETQWARRIGVGYMNFALGLAADARGGVYVAGSMRKDTTNVNPWIGPFQNAFLAHYDASGSIGSVQVAEAADEDSWISGRGVVIGPDGEVVMVGAIRGTVVFPDPTGAGSATTASENGAFVAKYDVHGNLAWVSKSARVVSSERFAIPKVVILSAAYPNPFQTRAEFTLELQRGAMIRIELLDLLGRTVQVLSEGFLSPKKLHTFSIDAAGLPPGLYIYRVRGEGIDHTGMAIRAR